MDKTINITSLFPDLEFLGSRGAGEVIRLQMDKVLNDNNNVIIDFNKIDGVTQSFADEIIGIFVRAFGVTFIKNRIKVINANENIRKILNFVINYSKKHSAA